MKIFGKITALCLALVMCFGVCASAATGNVVTDDLTTDFQKLEIKIVANKINVFGIAGAAEEAMVSFYMVEGESIVYAKQVMTDEGGAFEAELILAPNRYNADNSGKLLVGCSNANTVEFADIELYSQNELDSCVADFKEITSGADVGEFLSNYGDMLAIETEYTEEELGILYDKYTENSFDDISNCDAVIAAIDGLVTYVDDYRAFFAAINAAAENGDSTEVKVLITDTYKHLITFDTNLTMIQNEDAMYQKMVEAFTEPYANLADVEAAFKVAMLAQRDEEAVNGYLTEDRSKGFIDEEWKLSINANYVTISGKTDDLGEHNIVFYVSDYNVSTPNILGLYQVKTEKDGSFMADFTLDASVYGDEAMGIIQVSGKDRNIYQFCIDLCTEDFVDSMFSDFKGIGDEEDMKNFLEVYSDALNVGVGHAEDKIILLTELYGENDYSELTDPDKTAKAFMTLDNSMYDVKSFIDTMNKYSAKKLWGYIRDAIENDKNNMAEKSKTFAKLENLAETCDDVSEKGLYMRMTELNFSCVQDVIDAFEVAYEAQKEFEEESVTKPRPGGSSSSGGGGGFGGSNITDEFVVAPEYVPDTTPEELDAEKKPVDTFVDLEGYDWAKTAINGLRNRSIVRGDGNGNYRPGDNVTREEFLSMLLATLYIKTEAGTVPFTDVKNGAWYTDVVATAYNRGITNGMGDGTFGIGQNIIRADMVVLASRLLENSGLAIEKGEVARIFADYTEIPEYAYNAVVAMQQAGLVNGDNESKFRPTDELTRAEAAVFFWNIFNYIESQI